MSKIHKITVSNLKAVSSQTATFEGCTAIITGGNNKGKTSFLRSLPDRIRGIKPEVVLKHNEQEGFAELELTTKEKFRWEFKEGKEKLTFITDKAIKIPATRAICDQYFPGTFDVDKFLQDPPRIQKKTLQQLVGIDFTEIDSRYKLAYDERERLNRIFRENKIVFDSLPVPQNTAPVDVSKMEAIKEEIRNRLNALYLKNKAENDKILNEWILECDKIRKEVAASNEEHDKRVKARIEARSYLGRIIELIQDWGIDKNIINLSGAESYISSMPEPQGVTPLILPEKPELLDPMPNDKELREQEATIEAARRINENAAIYKIWLEKKEKLQQDNEAAGAANIKVAEIEAERLKMIQGARMPEGFSFNEDGILYNDLPFTREQQSSSGLYIAALKLAAMTLGEVKTLHFDASFLDRNNLSEIEAWAEKEGLQLLIERPDFDGGEITYEIIQNHF